MNSVNLGNSELSVSELCLGTMYFGIKVPEGDAFELMDRYYDAGGRFFDTANKYSTWVPGFPEPVGEQFVGRWLKSRNRRSDVTIATKMGFSYQDVPRGLSRNLIIQEVEKSLIRLHVDCIDLLYAHADDRSTAVEETMEAFDYLIQSGKVRALGSSNFPSWRMALANSAAETNDWTTYCCTQTRLSVIWPKVHADFGNQIAASPELLDYCKDRSITVLAYSPLLQGFFGREDRELPDSYDTPDNELIIELIRAEAGDSGVNPNVVVLAWMREQGIIPLITGSNPDQIDQNLLAADYSVSTEIGRKISDLYYPKDQA